MISFVIGFLIGAAVATTVFVVIGKKRYKQAARLIDKNVKDILIHNED